MWSQSGLSLLGIFFEIVCIVARPMSEIVRGTKVLSELRDTGAEITGISGISPIQRTQSLDSLLSQIKPSEVKLLRDRELTILENHSPLTSNSEPSLPSSPNFPEVSKPFNAASAHKAEVVPEIPVTDSAKISDSDKKVEINSKPEILLEQKPASNAFTNRFDVQDSLPNVNTAPSLAPSSNKLGPPLTLPRTHSSNSFFKAEIPLEQEPVSNHLPQAKIFGTNSLGDQKSAISGNQPHLISMSESTPQSAHSSSQEVPEPNTSTSTPKFQIASEIPVTDSAKISDPDKKAKISAPTALPVSSHSEGLREPPKTSPEENRIPRKQDQSISPNAETPHNPYLQALGKEPQHDAVDLEKSQITHSALPDAHPHLKSSHSPLDAHPEVTEEEEIFHDALSEFPDPIPENHPLNPGPESQPTSTNHIGQPSGKEPRHDISAFVPPQADNSAGIGKKEKLNTKPIPNDMPKSASRAENLQTSPEHTSRDQINSESSGSKPTIQSSQATPKDAEKPGEGIITPAPKVGLVKKVIAQLKGLFIRLTKLFRKSGKEKFGKDKKLVPDADEDVFHDAPLALEDEEVFHDAPMEFSRRKET